MAGGMPSFGSGPTTSHATCVEDAAIGVRHGPNETPRMTHHLCS